MYSVCIYNKYLPITKTSKELIELKKIIIKSSHRRNKDAFVFIQTLFIHLDNCIVTAAMFFISW